MRANILNWLDAAIDEFEGYPGGLISARETVAELLVANARTVRAFEALGRANGVIPSLEAHRECEAALVAQKAAFAKATGEGA